MTSRTGKATYFEGVTHSICTLEFVPHRPLYDHFIDELKEGNDLDRPPSSSDRIQPSEPDLYRHEQTQIARIGKRRSGKRMGRPTNADPLRVPPPRLFS